MVRYLLFLLPWFWFHEAGHYLVARLFHAKLTFLYREGNLWGISVPRYRWWMPPGLTERQRWWIYHSGFYLEYLMTIPFLFLSITFGILYGVGALAHRLLYTHYGGSTKEVS